MSYVPLTILWRQEKLFAGLDFDKRQMNLTSYPPDESEGVLGEVSMAM